MITASIVLYNENLETLKRTVESFLKIPLNKKLYLIDNSFSNLLEKHFNHQVQTLARNSYLGTQINC